MAYIALLGAYIILLLHTYFFSALCHNQPHAQQITILANKEYLLPGKTFQRISDFFLWLSHSMQRTPQIEIKTTRICHTHYDVTIYLVKVQIYTKDLIIHESSSIPLHYTSCSRGYSEHVMVITPFRVVSYSRELSLHNGASFTFYPVDSERAKILY